ncbi:helix-turn-helix domain-containing protein [Saccharothrix sp. HUAS TT1]|uniref:helix-turn-helix domain-containing protein n=1 Tax=unclassified Saccharothrix TaxID=2593673 RepID=UPI00345C5953
MGKTVQTIPRRLLGGELRRLRLEAGRSQAQVARAIGKDQARINKLEDGQTNLKPEDLAALLDFLGANDEDRAKITAMGVEARKRQPRSRAYVDLLPGSYNRIATMQGQASAIKSYERGIFPGLLQCHEYAEAIVAACDGLWWESSERERANRVAFRLERQRRVVAAEPPKDLEFIVTDDALRTRFGGPEVMRRQFEHILEVTADRPNIEMRLLPATAADNPAPHGGLTLLSFAEPAPPVGFVSVVYGPSPYLDQRSDTEALTRVFDQLRGMALSPAESRAALEEALRRS